MNYTKKNLKSTKPIGRVAHKILRRIENDKSLKFKFSNFKD